MTARTVTEQADTERVSFAKVMRNAGFAAGVDDVRAGRPGRFDEFDDGWEYERGRQFAAIAPMSMPLRIKGKLNPKALRLFGIAIIRGHIR